MSINLDNEGKSISMYFGTEGANSNFITQAYLGNDKLLDFETISKVTQNNYSDIVEFYNAGFYDTNSDYISLGYGGYIKFKHPVLTFKMLTPTFTDAGSSNKVTTLEVEVLQNGNSIDSHYLTWTLEVTSSTNGNMYYFINPPSPYSGGSWTMRWDENMNLTPFEYNLGNDKKLIIQRGKTSFSTTSGGYQMYRYNGYSFIIRNTGANGCFFTLSDVVIQK